MSAKTVAIITGSSNSGRSCLDTLLSFPNPPKINALFRSPDKAHVVREAYPTANVNCITGIDAADPNTLKPAFSNCEAAVLVTPASSATDMAHDGVLVTNMINAAVEAGVIHIIFVGSWTVNAADQCPTLAARFLPGELLLKDAEAKHGITWTVLRGGFFQSNYPSIMKAAKGGEFRFFNFCVPSNDPCDIGRVAAAVLYAPAEHHGKCYEVSGPEKLWLRDAVNIIADVSGQPVKFVETSVAQAIADLPLFLKEVFQYLAENGEDAVPLTDDVFRITGKKPKSFREWATENRAALGA